MRDNTGLTITLVKSLDNSNSSIIDCVDLITELNMSIRTLKVISQSRTPKFQQSQIFAALIDDVTKRCHRDMGKFCENVHSYHEGCSRGLPLIQDFVDNMEEE